MLSVQVEVAGRTLRTYSVEDAESLWAIVVKECESAPHGVIAAYIEREQ